MHEVLEQLSDRLHAKAALVVTSDGMVVAGTVQADFRKDVIGALSSFLILATNRCLKRAQQGGFGRIVLHATHGKVLVQSFRDYFLVVLTDQFVDKEALLEAALEAVARLRRLASIKV